MTKKKSLKDLLEDLDFLVEEARRGLPPCVYGTIQRIEKAYNLIKDYIKNSEYKKNGRRNC